MSRLGLIADTHNYLDPAVPDAFAGVAHILHAGDIGRPALLHDLERLAPVTAVAGNTDGPFGWRETEVVEAGGLKCLLRHIVDPHALAPAFRERLKRVRPDVVVFGHTHRPFCERRDGVWFVNPGSASRPRGGHAPSVALLHVEQEGPRVEFVRLP
jgi:putative phosphoesterase